MKSTFTLAVLCISLTLTSAFYIPSITSQQAQTLANTQDSTASTLSATQTSDLDAFKAFITGLLKGAAGVTASDSLKCVKTNADASSLLSYYAGFAAAAGNSPATSVLDNTRIYINTLGARYLKKVDKKITKCLDDSKDFKAVEKKWGANTDSKEFAAAFSSNANKDPYYFQNLFSAINSAFQNGQYSAAGSLFGGFSKNAGFAAGRSKKNH